MSKHSALNHYSLYTREHTQEKSPTDAVIVGKFSHRRHSSLYIRELTEERNPMNAVIVRNLLAISQNFSYTREPMQEKNPVYVVNVGKLSSVSVVLIDTKEHMKRHPMNAVNVGIPLVSSHISVATKISYWRGEVTWIQREIKHSRRPFQHEITGI